jgi:hypothetical protein
MSETNGFGFRGKGVGFRVEVIGEEGQTLS